MSDFFAVDFAMTIFFEKEKHPAPPTSDTLSIRGVARFNRMETGLIAHFCARSAFHDTRNTATSRSGSMIKLLQCPALSLSH